MFSTNFHEVEIGSVYWTVRKEKMLASQNSQFLTDLGQILDSKSYDQA